jgi:uncharacterized protein
MSLDTLALVLRRIGHYLVENPQEKVELVWHGGEPLLLGHDFFLRALELQHKYCDGALGRLSHSIQSNITLVDKGFVKVFRQMKVSGLGTSFEPIPHLRGFGATRDSDTYNRKFIDSVALLEESGINWSYIYVVTKRSLPLAEKLFYFLTNFTLHGSLMLNPVLIYGEDVHGLQITQSEYADFLGEFFKLWWLKRGSVPDVVPFIDYLSLYSGRDSGLTCSSAGRCAGTHLYIGPDGSTSQCGRSADWGIIQYKNIKEAEISDILSDERRMQIRDRSEILRAGECSGCRFWEMCHGGCPLDSFIEKHSFAHKSNWCAAKKLFLEKYFEPITGMRYAMEVK